MLRDITIGQYYQTDSVIHRLDPRVKLMAVSWCDDFSGGGDKAVKGSC